MCSTAPRVRVCRAVVASLAVVFVVAFWLFYASHVVKEPDLVRYKSLAAFALNLVYFVAAVVAFLELLKSSRRAGSLLQTGE